MKVNVAVPGSHPSFNKPTAVSVDIKQHTTNQGGHSSGAV